MGVFMKEIVQDKDYAKSLLDVNDLTKIIESIERYGWIVKELEDCLMFNIRSDIFYISHERISRFGSDRIVQYCKDRSFMYEFLAL